MGGFKQEQEVWTWKTVNIIYIWNDGLPGYNVNVSADQQPEFRSLNEFYITIFSK